MIFIRTLIVTFVVAGVLNLLTRKSQKKAGSTSNFVVRASMDLSGLGAIGMIVIIGILIFCQIKNAYMPLLIIILFIIVGVVPSLFLLITPVKGVWDVIVEGDDITVVKAFIFKRHWKFSDITYGKLTRGGMKIYVKGRKRKAFFVDGMFEGFLTFLQRMAEEEKETDCPGGIKNYVKKMEEYVSGQDSSQDQ